MLQGIAVGSIKPACVHTFSTVTGDNLVIPRPAFALYQTLSESKGIVIKSYDLVPARQWEADLESLESLIDDR